MQQSDILIIGAGAAGLMAARELLRYRKSVHILEARNRIGGRIHSLHDPHFARPVELGAEFIHGKLPITFSLMKEYNINKTSLEGKMWHAANGEITRTPEYIPGSEELEKALHNLHEDMSVKNFLDTYLGAPSQRELYEDIQRFVEGYDAADINDASALTLKKEWFDAKPEQQFRPEKGYGELIEKLAADCKKLGAEISLNTIAKEIHWKPSHTEIITNEGIKYNSEQVLVTVPLGILQSEPDDIAHIQFLPDIPEKFEAAKKLGYGCIIKIILHFNDAFWNHTAHKKLKRQLGFLFTDAGVPTWWTYATGDVPMLCGWIGGPKAAMLKDVKEHLILDLAISTLSQIFGEQQNEICDMILHYHISRWTEDPFALGAYSYAVVNGESYKNILAEPLEKTLFFAGEALDEGGTVEAAVASALSVVKRML